MFEYSRMVEFGHSQQHLREWSSFYGRGCSAIRELSNSWSSSIREWSSGIRKWSSSIRECTSSTIHIELDHSRECSSFLWESKFEHSRMSELLEFEHSQKNWKVRPFANGRTFMGEPPDCNCSTKKVPFDTIVKRKLKQVFN